MYENLSPQEAAAAFANNQLNDMNMAALDMYGVDVLWFRAVPQLRSSDVIFQSYTLHNVEQCPLKTKVMYTDTNYDDAALTFSFNGIEYKPTLTLEIPVGTWAAVTNLDGTLPQKKDIVYIPMTKKLWQVSSMTPVAAIGGQITSYKMLMETYKPEADRLIGDELQQAIDETTVSVDKLFGKSIDNALKDLTDKPQLANTVPTNKNEYRDLTSNKTTDEIIPKEKIMQTVQGNLEIDGHLVARSYYNMNMTNPIVIEYKNINDFVSLESERCLSLWVSPLSEITDSYKVDSIKITKKDSKYTYLEIESKTKNISVGDGVTLYRNSSIKISGIVVCNDDNFCIKVPNKIVEQIDSMIDDWHLLKNYKIRKDNPINLLEGVCENGLLSINIISKRYIDVQLPTVNYVCDLDMDLIDEKWYGIIINISAKSLNINIFEPKEQLTQSVNIYIPIKNTEQTYTRYYIKHSASYITNIRLYNIGNHDIDKQITDLVSYNINDNSKAIINDSADVYLGLKYFGEQR